jgi:hypothetical protein
MRDKLGLAPGAASRRAGSSSGSSRRRGSERGGGFRAAPVAHWRIVPRPIPTARARSSSTRSGASSRQPYADSASPSSGTILALVGLDGWRANPLPPAQSAPYLAPRCVLCGAFFAPWAVGHAPRWRDDALCPVLSHRLRVGRGDGSLELVEAVEATARTYAGTGDTASGLPQGEDREHL